MSAVFWPYMLAPLYAMAAPAIGPQQFGENQTTTFLDWVAGVQVSPYSVDLRVGYLGSRGLYTNLSERRSKLFARAALQANWSHLPYLMGGLDELPFSDEIKGRIGRTWVFGRRLEWWTAEQQAEAAASSPEDIRDIALTTGHIEQYWIKDRFDVKVAWSVQPTITLHQLTGAIRTDGYGEDPDSGRASAQGRLEAGLVTLPDLTSSGVVAGPG